jgi:hypothetical protein
MRLLTLLTITVAIISLSIAHDSDGSPPSNARSAASCGGGVSVSFDISGDVVNSRAFNSRSLRALTPSSLFRIICQAMRGVRGRSPVFHYGIC